MTRKDKGYYPRRTYAEDYDAGQKDDRKYDVLLEGLRQYSSTALSPADIRRITGSLFKSKPSKKEPGSQALVSKYGLASFNDTPKGTVNHGGAEQDSAVPECYISYRNTTTRDQAKAFSLSHKKDHPTLATAADWQEQFTRVSTLAWLNDVEQGRLVQHLCHVDHANDPPVTTQDGLSKLETDVRVAENKLSGILFIVSRFQMPHHIADTLQGPCGTNSNATWDGKSLGGVSDLYQ